MINCAKFYAGFFLAGKAAGSVDTGGINGFCQRSMPEKRQVKCASYHLTAPMGRRAAPIGGMSIA
ncbi:MAG: hypothetical protein LBS85_05140 [Clostridiales Family XIII bacterium]|jgi:hypothetical protein|nr:hypothetical protein [Clostridiales Family XIII bacterium]